MRVLISAMWLGGKGGAERELHSILRVLAHDNVELVYGRREAGPWSEVPERTRARSWRHWRWRGGGSKPGKRFRLVKPLVNRVRRALGPDFDLHIAFGHGPDLSAARRAKLRLVVTNGVTLTDDGPYREYVVALEAPDNGRYVPPEARTVLLPPPYYPLADAAIRPMQAELPPRYLLTVFNPHARAKGTADLAAAAGLSPLPIVWCHRERRVDVAHPNIVHMIDPTPEEMRFLYEECAAYVSFSVTESFGYALADALQYSRVVVSRPVGVMSYPQVRAEGGVHLIEGTDFAVDWGTVLRDEAPLPQRDLTWLAPEAYRARLVELLDERGL